LKSGEEIILGIDPGTLVLGYGLISIESNQPRLVEMGVLHLSKWDDHAIRLNHIFNKMTSLIRLHKPLYVAIEAPFFGKNVQSMLKLGRAQGVAIASAMAAGLQAVEYAPRKIKQSVTGNGNATKEQVWKMLQQTLSVDEDPAYFDATDAVAVALCHFYQKGNPIAALKQPTTVIKKNKKNTWDAFVAGNPERVK